MDVEFIGNADNDNDVKLGNKNMNRDNSTVVQNEVEKEVETSTLSDISTSTNHTKVSYILCSEKHVMFYALIIFNCVQFLLLLLI